MFYGNCEIVGGKVSGYNRGIRELSTNNRGVNEVPRPSSGKDGGWRGM